MNPPIGVDETYFCQRQLPRKAWGAATAATKECIPMHLPVRCHSPRGRACWACRQGRKKLATGSGPS